MLAKLFRSAIIGAIVAGILLAIMPLLRSNTALFSRSHSIQSEDVPLSYNQAVRRAAPAVVNVYSRESSSETNGELNIRLLGSGVIMSEKGYVLTNNHVINNIAQLVISLQDGRVYEASVIGTDKLTDLAVVKMEAANLPVITINEKRTAHIGDVVLAIGNPYNLGQTVTQGIISATGRVGLSLMDGSGSGFGGRQNFLQTDASINHGNSGGALVNTLGELVGINTLTFDKGSDGETPEGIGFAIPVALATKVMGKLIRDGRVIRGYIGINGAQAEGLSPNSTLDGNKRLQGVIVMNVEPGGPADKGGMKKGDVLLTMNGKPAVSVIETMDQVAEIRPGTAVPVAIRRGDQEMTLSVTIQEFPES